jgi:hypothetical protein
MPDQRALSRPGGAGYRRAVPTDYDKEFSRYIERFDRQVGHIETGQYGNYRGRLVCKLHPDAFRSKVDEYMELGRRFTEMLSSGDTIDDALAVELRSTEIELVLEKSMFLPGPVGGR